MRLPALPATTVSLCAAMRCARPSVLAIGFVCSTSLSLLALANGKPPTLPDEVFETAHALIEAQLASPELRALLEDAEAAFTRGDVELAQRRFATIAATVGEVPMAELGEVRALFQTNRFHEAIAMGNLVVGEHPGYSDATALLAYRQDRAGYTPQSLAALRKARARHPDDPILLAAMSEILIDRGRATEAIAELDVWLAAYPATFDLLQLRSRADLVRGDVDGSTRWRALAAYLPRSKRDGVWRQRYSDPLPERGNTLAVLANGAVIDGGRRVLTRMPLLQRPPGTLYVRNGVGRVRAARVEYVDPGTGATLLLLDAPYDAQWSLHAGDLADVVAAGPCLALAFPSAAAAEVLHPRLTTGFVVAARMGDSPLLATTTSFALREGGALLLDAQGRLIGLGLADHDGVAGEPDRQSAFGTSPLAMRVDVLRTSGLLPVTASTQPTGSVAKTQSTDAIYDRLAPAIVQVLGHE